MFIFNIAGILLSRRPKSVWKTLTNSLERIILMNVALSIVFHEWTVKRSLAIYRLVLIISYLYIRLESVIC